MQMHHAPFRFDRTFPDAPPPGLRTSGDAVMHATALEAELFALREAQAAALDEAWQQGHAAGVADERDGIASATLIAVDALHGAIAELGSTVETHRSRLSDELIDVALAAGEAIAGHQLAGDLAGAVRDNLRRLIDTLVRGTALHVRVHPDLVAPLAAHVTALQAGDRRRLSVDVSGDEAIVPGDARIDWDQGGCTLDRAQRHAAVLDAFGEGDAAPGK